MFSSAKKNLSNTLFPNGFDVSIYDFTEKVNGKKFLFASSFIFGFIIAALFVWIMTSVKKAIHPSEGFFSMVGPSGWMVFIGFVIFAAISLVCYSFLSGAYDRGRAKDGGVKRSKNNTYGSSHFADVK
jgi:hypothetical protein